MADRISSLSDEVLCYILSFLPTEISVATSVLSKRWKPLWRSVPTFDFENHRHNTSHRTYSRFVQSVYTFIFSRDLYQPFLRFRLSCLVPFACDTPIVNTWLNAAAQCRVEHLDLRLDNSIHLFSNVFRCKTLTVLKLTNLTVKTLSSVDLPSLKILHLDFVKFIEYRHLVEFLSGTPNLEDLEIKDLWIIRYVRREGVLKRLPKLLRAVIIKSEIPLDLVSNVHFLHIHKWIECQNIEKPIPEFHNLTHVEFGYLNYDKYWMDRLEVLTHCPKLQNLSVEKKHPDLGSGGGVWTWRSPPCVPECISLHLKTCCLKSYTGIAGEFEFAKYIMQNARVLRDMTICTCTRERAQVKLKMIKELSSCTRLSSTCKLSFN